jgi:hypothetical protein
MIVGGLPTSMLSESTPPWLAMLAITPPYAREGFLFPVTVLGLLATTEQVDQAVVMTTPVL